ncbi:MAG TPA: efflux RND transporter permease subunit, partial [Vicinamibacterales bacterium]|nr:efflux RND transporter permease subunit [Vicinamibacterales bacterium]
MINRIVSFALAHRFIVIVVMAGVAVWGALSFRNLPIDAYPDLSPPQVQVVAQWPGHAAEEIERLITIPLEVEMNGIPKLDALRSISLYGLSSITMNFQFETDPYFARQQVFERIPNATLPAGVSAGMSPLFSPSGLIYRYVLQSPDQTPAQLKIIEDWVLERKYRAIQGVADDSGLGGETLQYQVQIDPHRLMSYGVTVPQIVQQLSANNSNAGGGFYSQGGQFYYVRGLGQVRSLDDIGNIVVASHAGIPVTIKDVGTVTTGAAPRLGEFGYMRQNDAVEGVIL